MAEEEVKRKSKMKKRTPTDNILPFQLELKVSYIIVGRWFIRPAHRNVHSIFRNFRSEQILEALLFFSLSLSFRSFFFSHFHSISCVFSFIKQFVNFLLFEKFVAHFCRSWSLLVLHLSIHLEHIEAFHCGFVQFAILSCTF